MAEKKQHALQEFEHRETRLKARAACNLCCLSLLEGDVAQAGVHASLATASDRYSAAALVAKVTRHLVNTKIKPSAGQCADARGAGRAGPDRVPGCQWRGG